MGIKTLLTDWWFPSPKMGYTIQLTIAHMYITLLVTLTEATCQLFVGNNWNNLQRLWMKISDPYFWRFSPKHKDNVTKFLSSTVSLFSGTEPKRIRRLFAEFSCRRWLSTRRFRWICSISYDIGDKQKWLDYNNHSNHSWIYQQFMNFIIDHIGDQPCEWSSTIYWFTPDIFLESILIWAGKIQNVPDI